MNIIKNQTDKSLNIALEGRLDTTTAPELEAELKQSIGDSAELNLDFAKLEYLSSAGLVAQKIMNKQGKMVIRNVNDVISEVFEVTGFSDILTIE
jgi:anti-sigma B factor antagonist